MKFKEHAQQNAKSQIVVYEYPTTTIIEETINDVVVNLYVTTLCIKVIP